MQPIMMLRGVKDQENRAQEATWRKQGEDAAERGEDKEQWPRVGRKYSADWYRAKNAWQAGWLTSIGMPLSRYSVEDADLKHRSINDRLFFLIREKAPITVRNVLRSFNVRYRDDVKAILAAFEEHGFIKTTGRGTRSSPFTIERVL